MLNKSDLSKNDFEDAATIIESDLDQNHRGPLNHMVRYAICLIGIGESKKAVDVLMEAITLPVQISSYEPLTENKDIQEFAEKMIFLIDRCGLRSDLSADVFQLRDSKMIGPKRQLLDAMGKLLANPKIQAEQNTTQDALEGLDKITKMNKAS